MGSVVSKRRVRSLLLIIPRVAPGVSLQGDTASAPAVHRELGRPAAAHGWEERACDQAKGWGECPADRRAGAPVASSLSARSARPTSCPCRRPHRCSDALAWRVGKESVRVTAGFIGGGVTDKATRPTGGLTLSRQKEPMRGIPPKPSFPGSAGV